MFKATDTLFQGHPNVKLFFTHGGALSTQEALYHGVPIVVMPSFLDQKSNAFRFESRQLGMVVNFKTITADIVRDVITTAISNPV